MVELPRSYRIRRAASRAVFFLTGAESVELHFSERLFEWYATAVMCCIALSMATPKPHFIGAFADMAAWGFDRHAFMIFFGIFGSARLFALFANGNLRNGGPRIRAFCAMAASPVWFLLSFALLNQWIQSGELSLGLSFYGPLTVCDIYAAKRATLDVGRC